MNEYEKKPCGDQVSHQSDTLHTASDTLTPGGMAMVGYTPAASGDDKVWMMFIISSGVSKRQRVSRTFRSSESRRSLQFTRSQEKLEEKSGKEVLSSKSQKWDPFGN